jgi:hypothetical protein
MKWPFELLLVESSVPSVHPSVFRWTGRPSSLPSGDGTACWGDRSSGTGRDGCPSIRPSVQLQPSWTGTVTIPRRRKQKNVCSRNYANGCNGSRRRRPSTGGKVSMCRYAVGLISLTEHPNWPVSTLFELIRAAAASKCMKYHAESHRTLVSILFEEAWTRIYKDVVFSVW